MHHIPSNITIVCAEQRSQAQNREKALYYLKQRLFNAAYQAKVDEQQKNRKIQVGSAMRSERIRTYNYLQDRVTDHRIQKNYTGITRFLSIIDGTLNELHKILKQEHKLELFYENLKK
jgi:peptide chain release factor 1